VVFGQNSRIGGVFLPRDALTVHPIGALDEMVSEDAVLGGFALDFEDN